MILKLPSLKLKWPRRAKAAPGEAAQGAPAVQTQSSPVPDILPGSHTLIERKRYVFGLEWRLIPATQSLTRTLIVVKKEGKALYVISEMENIIGVSAVPIKLRGPKYSAALHLASKVSQGGLELYAFALADEQFAVVALNESCPIPGFDFLGRLDQAQALIEEFHAIQMGQPIRQVGNADLLEGEEKIAPEDIFDLPIKASRIKVLMDTRRTGWLLAVGALLAIAFAGATYWLQTQREEVMQQNRQVVENPNIAYRASVAAAFGELSRPGPQLLRAWLARIEGLPVHHAGWRLVRVDCKPALCTAQWDRVYGSYADFFARLPLNTTVAKEVQTGNDPLKASVLTEHPVDKLPAAPNAWQMDELPAAKDGLRIMSSQLQELSLLGSMKTTLEPPKLLGTATDPAALTQSVSSGSWTVRHDLWTLAQLPVPAHSVPKSLLVDLVNDKGEAQPSYLFTAAYYVRGKDAKEAKGLKDANERMGAESLKPVDAPPASVGAGSDG
jgi:hypothetical protein